MGGHNFRRWLEESYAENPAAVGAFANRSCKLVRVSQRWYRGHKVVADDTTVTVGGEAVGSEATTRPRWKLLPKAVADEFADLGRGVENLLTLHCASGADDDDGRRPLLTGGGNYAVAAENWPRLWALLEAAREAWARAADRWTTDDGYAEFHRLLAEQLGEADYKRVKDLVPVRDRLRAKFALDVTPLPVRLVVDSDDPAERKAAAGAVVELLEAAVRRPREAAADAWLALALQLVEGDGTKALDPPARNGRAGSRSVRGQSVRAARRAVTALHAWHGYLDDALLGAAAAVRAELPDEAAAAGEVAKKLNRSDDEALRVGRILLKAARAAADEAGMCAGLGRAMAGRKP